MKEVKKLRFGLGFQVETEKGQVDLYSVNADEDVSGTYVQSSGYDELLRERNELAAQVERLRGALDLMCDRAAQVDGWESFPSKWIDEALEVYAELPAHSLEAVKREWKESIDSAIEGFAFTTSEGQWVVHRDDVSGLLSK